MDLPSKTLHHTIIFLLLLALAVQPVVAAGQIMEHAPESESPVMMDCCEGELHSHSGHDMPCHNMMSADCASAAGLGSCGSAVFALIPEGPELPAQMITRPKPLHPHDAYFSIILDTLTPPPNSSKA